MTATIPLPIEQAAAELRRAAADEDYLVDDATSAPGLLIFRQAWHTTGFGIALHSTGPSTTTATATSVRYPSRYVLRRMFDAVDATQRDPSRFDRLGGAIQDWASGRSVQPGRPVDPPIGPNPVRPDPQDAGPHHMDAITSDDGGDIQSAPAEATLKIQPDASRYWTLYGRSQIGVLVMALAVALVASYRRGLHPTFGAVVLVLTVFLADAGRTWWHILRGRVEVRATELVVQRLLGPSRAIPRGSLAVAVYAPLYQLNSKVRVCRLYVLDRDGKPVVRLLSIFFSRPVMETFLSALTPLTTDLIGEPITPRTLDRRHPGMLSFQDRHSATAIWINLLAPALAVLLIFYLLWR